MRVLHSLENGMNSLLNQVLPSILISSEFILCFLFISINRQTDNQRNWIYFNTSFLGRDNKRVDDINTEPNTEKKILLRKYEFMLFQPFNILNGWLNILHHYRD